MGGEARHGRDIEGLLDGDDAFCVGVEEEHTAVICKRRGWRCG